MAKSFEELIKERQSCRDFSDKPLKKADVYELIDIAKNAPSACNSQPWRLFVTTEKSDNEKMRKCLQDGGKNGFLNGAQAFVAVYEKGGIKLNAGTETKFAGSRFTEYDVGEFVAYLTLAAKDKGIDSCIIGWVNNDKINDSFGISGKCALVVALGYAKDKTVRRKSRSDVKDIIINYSEE